MEDTGIIEEINNLKQDRGAIILVHNYQYPEIQLMADLLGDSFGLSKKASESDAEVIVFCGVYFMAESAKILNPEKTVLLPEINAGCSLADCADAESVLEMRRRYPEAGVVTYINSTAEVKAVSDICCTSANALKVVNSMPQDEIIMLPDYNLADWVSRQTDKKIIKWEGACHVHDRLTVEQVKEAKRRAPNALVMAHPECRPEVLELSDYITGTSGMLKLAKELNGDEFIIATDIGLAQRMKRENPDKRIYPVTEDMFCEYMKITNLESLRDSLRDMKHNIEVDEEMRKRAYKALDKMLEVI